MRPLVLALLGLAMLGAIASTVYFQAQQREGASALREVDHASFLPPSLELADDRPVALRFARIADLDPRRDALVIVGDGIGYEANEARAIAAFLRDGGHVLIATRGGAGAQLLEELGAGITVSREPLYSAAFQGEPERVLVSATGRLPRGPAEAAVLDPRPVFGGEPLYVTADLTWIDEDGDDRPDVSETFGSVAVASAARIGAGTLVVVGAPSFLVGAPPDLASAILDLADGEGRTLLLDEGHRARGDPFHLSSTLAGLLPPHVVVAILMMVALVGGAIVLRPRLRKLSLDEPATPDVDPRTLKEILSELDEA